MESKAKRKVLHGEEFQKTLDQSTKPTQVQSVLTRSSGKVTIKLNHLLSKLQLSAAKTTVVERSTDNCQQLVLQLSFIYNISQDQRKRTKLFDGFYSPYD